jgi:hypothetical protein
MAYANLTFTVQPGLRFKPNDFVNLTGTDTPTTTTTTTSGGAGIAVSADLGNTTAAVCAATPGVTRYTTTGAIAPGLTLYTNAALTTPQTGYSYVANDAVGAIYNLNSSTGLIGTFVQSC